MPKKSKSTHLPVTLLSGFLGSGKTTLLKLILESNQHKLKIAVIVNDMASLNIDSSIIEKSGLIQTQQEILSLQNGCICCTLRTDLIREVDRIQKMGCFDYLIIESTGISEPMQVAESFCADPDSVELAEDIGEMLWNTARLDTCVTVVDTFEFETTINSLQSFNQRFQPMDGEAPLEVEEGEKNIGQLLVEQIEFANVILLNKIDLVSEEQQKKVKSLIATLNPSAKVLFSSFGVVPLQEILNTGLFNMETAKLSPGWLQSLHQNRKYSTEKLSFNCPAIQSESAEYGVTHFVYQGRRPFHPNRLYKLLQAHFILTDEHKPTSKLTTSSMKEDFGQVLRSKGFCWIAGRDSVTCEWAHTGRLLSLNPSTQWFCELEEKDWGLISSEAEKDAIKANFHPLFGDRRQELVFIGIELKQAAIIAALDGCLLTEVELLSHDLFASYQYFDPLPCWPFDIGETPGLWNTVVRVGQKQKIMIPSGAALNISGISLDEKQTGDDDNDESHFTPKLKVWLDNEHRHQSTLLCTLEPDRCEQFATSLCLAAGVTSSESSEDDSCYCFRVELQSKSTRRKRKYSVIQHESLQQQQGFDVHIVGYVSFEEASEEEGTCPLSE